MPFSAPAGRAGRALKTKYKRTRPQPLPAAPGMVMRNALIVPADDSIRFAGLSSRFAAAALGEPLLRAETPQRISGPNISEGWRALGVGDPSATSEKRFTEAFLIQHAVYRHQRSDSAQHGHRFLATAPLVRHEHVGAGRSTRA